MNRTFLYGAAFEALLLVLAALLAWLSGQPMFSSWTWALRDLVAGLAAVIPAFAFFVWSYSSPRPWAQRLRRIFESDLHPFFHNWSIAEIAIISLIAGVAEEVLFRGVIQMKLALLLDPWSAIVLTSILFGLVHCISKEYALITGIISIYLGLLFWSTGNLLTPMVTHAVYDFVALAYFLKWR